MIVDFNGKVLVFKSHLFLSTGNLGLHRGWRRMLETKYVGDNFEMLVTVLPDFVTNILYLLALAVTNTRKLSLT